MENENRELRRANEIRYETSDLRRIDYWDGTTVDEITDNDYEDYEPSLSGSLIAWTVQPEGSEQIFYVNVERDASGQRVRARDQPASSPIGQCIQSQGRSTRRKSKRRSPWSNV